MRSENGVAVRLIQYDELERLLDLYEHFEHDDPRPQEGEALTRLWDDIYHDPSLHYVVAVKGDQLVATCNITIIKNLTRNTRPYGLIENVVTHREHRNQGYGKLVLEKAVDIAREKNCYKVMLLTSSKKEETLKFYETAGFQRGVKTGFVMPL